MTVAELIEELKNFDGETEVHFSYNYGDHGKTTVAPKVESVDEEYVMHSSYHSMDKVADEDDFDKYEGKKRTDRNGNVEDVVRTVVVLSA